MFAENGCMYEFVSPNIRFILYKTYYQFKHNLEAETLAKFFSVINCCEYIWHKHNVDHVMSEW